jgi:hypothetical protein
MATGFAFLNRQTPFAVRAGEGHDSMPNVPDTTGRITTRKDDGNSLQTPVSNKLFDLFVQRLDQPVHVAPFVAVPERECEAGELLAELGVRMELSGV